MSLIHWLKDPRALQESSHSKSKDFAERIEREHRRRLELGIQGLQECVKPVRFSVAARDFEVIMAAHWSDSTKEITSAKLKNLLPYFGKMILSEIRGDDVNRYQSLRKKAGVSARSINMEVGLVRQILRKHRLWSHIEPDVRFLRETSEVGRALTDDEVEKLMDAASKSRSRSFPIALTLLLNTGMRVSELRTMRWRQVDLLDRNVQVGQAKTKASERRVIPLNAAAYSALLAWRANFPDAKPEHCLFPSERYGLNGEDGYLCGAAVPYNVRPGVPIGSWKVAWTTCRKNAGVQCRLHDLRHTFVSRLAGAQVSDQTLIALAGWMSRQMLERYSHARTDSKRKAVDALDVMDSDLGYLQKRLQSTGEKKENVN